MNHPKSATRRLALGGILAAFGLTAVIALTASNLARFEIVGPTAPFVYPWRLAEPNAISQLTAWIGYVLHNLIAWGIIYFSQREKPRYASQLRWFNWAMLATHAVFIALHWLQSQLYYDALARDVPEVTALGSVALMLMVILILEAPRRGLVLGKKVKFHQNFLQIVRQYHGYLFSWAIIYTFWYHPTEGTFGHLAGFFYMFLLLWQSALLFNRTHVNKWWTFFLEFLVLPHGVLVAIFQGNALWPMFAFGFGAMIVLTQMYGLGLSTLTRRILAAVFIIAVLATYGLTGRLADLHEIVRIPVLDYLVVGLLYLLFLGGNAFARLFERRQPAMATSGD